LGSFAILALAAHQIVVQLEAELEMWRGGLNALDLPLPEGIASPQYFKTLRSSWIHQHGIGGAQVQIIVREIELKRRELAGKL
jgi:hypothetical protein